jgi:hypothetical protein
MRKLIASSFLAFFALVSFNSCRTGLRAEQDASELITVKFRVAGLNRADKVRTDLTYSLSGCGSEAVSGTYDPSGSVTFQTRNIKKGDSCDLSVKSTSGATAGIEWFSEPGLLYKAAKTPISSREGQLYGTAALQQMYSIAKAPTPNLVTLRASFKSPSALTDVCTCLLGTNPQLQNNVSVVEKSSGTQGLCSFANNASPEYAKLETATLLVQCGQNIFKGNWPAGTFVNAAAAGSIPLAELTLTPATVEEFAEMTIDVLIPGY